VQAAAGPPASSLTLAASEQRVIPNLVQYLREQGVPGVGTGTFAGALFASVDSGDLSGLFVGARTSSPGGGGRYGLFYAGVPHGRAASRSAWVFGLQQTAESRSNLALVNTGETDGSTDVFRIDIYDGATGALVRTLDGEAVGPRRFKQLNTLLRTFAPGTASGYVKVTKTGRRQPLHRLRRGQRRRRARPANGRRRLRGHVLRGRVGGADPVHRGSPDARWRLPPG